MAVVEKKGSQSWHRTVNETRIMRKWTCQYSVDIFPNYSNELPDIGDVFSATWPDLQVVDLRIDRESLSGADNVLLVVVYSTRGGRQDITQRPNHLGSWEESLDFNAEELTTEGYTKASDGTAAVWSTQWAADGTIGGDAQKAPPLSRLVPRQELNITAYSDSFAYKAVEKIAGRVNSDKQFLNTYSSFRQGLLFGGPQYIATDIFEVQPGEEDFDTGNWLLANSRISRTGERAWRYDFQWLRSPLGWGEDSVIPGSPNALPKIINGWNHPYGVVASVDMYNATEFFTAGGLLLSMGKGTATQEIQTA